MAGADGRQGEGQSKGSRRREEVDGGGREGREREQRSESGGGGVDGGRGRCTVLTHTAGRTASRPCLLRGVGSSSSHCAKPEHTLLPVDRGRHPPHSPHTTTTPNTLDICPSSILSQGHPAVQRVLFILKRQNPKVFSRWAVFQWLDRASCFILLITFP